MPPNPEALWPRSEEKTTSFLPHHGRPFKFKFKNVPCFCADYIVHVRDQAGLAVEEVVFIRCQLDLSHTPKIVTGRQPLIQHAVLDRWTVVLCVVQDGGIGFLYLCGVTYRENIYRGKRTFSTVGGGVLGESLKASVVYHTCFQ